MPCTRAHFNQAVAITALRREHMTDGQCARVVERQHRVCLRCREEEEEEDDAEEDEESRRS